MQKALAQAINSRMPGTRELDGPPYAQVHPPRRRQLTTTVRFGQSLGDGSEQPQAHEAGLARRAARHGAFQDGGGDSLAGTLLNLEEVRGRLRCTSG